MRDDLLMLQRMISGLRRDIANGNTFASLGKLDIIEGELEVILQEFNKEPSVFIDEPVQ